MRGAGVRFAVAVLLGAASLSAFAPTASAASVTIAGFAFSPASITIDAGQSVSWSNTDGFPHTATSDSGAFDTGTLNGGATSAPVTFSAAGTFPYHCAVHPSMTGTVVVRAPNEPPTLAPVGDRTAPVGQTLSFSLSASDPNGDPLTFSATGLPGTATLSSSGAFSWSPSAANVGSHAVTFRVSDGALSDEESVTIVVPSVNAPPVATFTRAVSNLVVNVDASASSDPDGDALSFSWSWGDGATGAGVTASHAYAAAGTFTITLTVSDGTASATASLSVSVSEPVVVNSAPVASFRAWSTALVAIADASGSSDPDGDALTFAWDWGDGARGEGVNATHAYAAPGYYVVVLTVTDARGLTAKTERTVTAVKPSTLPTAAMDLDVDGFRVRANASKSADADGDPLNFTWSWGDGSPASVGVEALHVYAKPGEYVIVLRVSDGSGVAEAARNVTAGPVNDAPAIRLLSGPTDGARVRGIAQWSGTAIDSDGDAVIVTARSDAGDAVAVVGASEWRIAWTPTRDGDGTLFVTASDGNASSTLQIRFFVGENRKPTVELASPAPGSEVWGVVELKGTAKDADGDAVRVEVSLDGGAWTGAGNRPGGEWVFRWDTTGEKRATHRVALRAYDGLVRSDPVEAEFTVLDPPRAPTAPTAPTTSGEAPDVQANDDGSEEPETGGSRAPAPAFAFALAALAATAVARRRPRA